MKKLLSIKKDQITDESQRTYAQWKKADTRKHMVYDSIYMKYL